MPLVVPFVFRRFVFWMLFTVPLILCASMFFQLFIRIPFGCSTSLTTYCDINTMLTPYCFIVSNVLYLQSVYFVFGFGKIKNNLYALIGMLFINLFPDCAATIITIFCIVNATALCLMLTNINAPALRVYHFVNIVHNQAKNLALIALAVLPNAAY